MGFSLFYIIESALLVANALAILNDRFLIKFGLTMDKLEGHSPASDSMSQGAPPSGIEEQQNREPKISLMSSKGQFIMLVHQFRYFMRWPLIVMNTVFIMLELLIG